jgi:hypothetical protein
MYNENVAKRARRVLAIAKDMADSLDISVLHRIDDITLHYDGYAEPGYESKSGIIALGNWNSVDRWDSSIRARVNESDLPERISEIFQKMNIECEWSDQWAVCTDCGK